MLIFITFNQREKIMAQGKMSNRQKMINMMYLVLLAILALNVSTEVLDAFVTIRNQLNASALEANVSALEFIDQMNQEIDREVKNEGKTANVGLKDTLEDIRNQTQNMIAVLNDHIREMEAIADYDPKEKDFRKKDELELNYQYWMGDNDESNDRRGNGFAMKLRDELNQHFRSLNTLYNSQIIDDSLKITPRQLEDPTNSNDPNKRWEQYTFEGPVMANLATLEAIKIDVLRQEKELLDLLNTRLRGYKFIPDKIQAISAPVSRIVPAGLPFETQLFVGMVSSAVKPEFKSGSGQVTVQEDGNSAMLKVLADGSRIPSGQYEAKQTYTATVRVPTATGTYEEIQVQEEFIVRKPEVLITSAAIQTLYRNSGNAVNIDVPALGEWYNPKIAATNATVRQSDRSKKRFMIVPNARESIVTVNSATNGQIIKVDAIKYNVIQPPRPTIAISVNGRAYNGTAPVNKKSRFEVKIIPNSEFKRLLPNDARYQVGKIEILMKNTLEPARVIKTLNMAGRNPEQGIRVTMPAEVQQARPGTKIFIRFGEVSRRNFKGDLFKERFSELERTVAFEIGR